MGLLKIAEERPVSATGESEQLRVQRALEGNSSKSIQQLSSELNINSSAVQRILKKFKYRRYKAVNCQQLGSNDKARRLQFCNWVPISGIDWKKVWFSDEKLFRLDGDLNKQNHRSWAASRPADIPINEGRTHSENTMVWIAISAEEIIGPYFFNEPSIYLS